MKIVQINTTCGIGSTGKICVDISKMLSANQTENYILCSKSNRYPLGVPCSSSNYRRLQALKSRILGNYGFNSQAATKKMISELDRINPDCVHLHNLHGHDCDLDMLFAYFKEHRTKLIWTFHDCWAFTGYCPYFTLISCDKWKSQCVDCVQRRKYSWFFDRSGILYRKKKKLFDRLELTVVTPSQWLADIVRQSFFGVYPVHVINNGIDLDIFKPSQSDFRQKFHLENRKIVLGVAMGWEVRKGIDVFIKLSERLPHEYRIVLVGTDDKTDRELPAGILSIHRSQNQQELAEIYSAADVFVNPTREENYPTVNMEAIACGTPVLTFRTGGSPEMLDETCGSVVDCNDIDALEKEIIHICTDKHYTKEACLKKAKEFDKNERFKEYIDLYERINVARTERH